MWRIPPLRRTNLEGALRVELTRSCRPRGTTGICAVLPFQSDTIAANGNFAPQAKSQASLSSATARQRAFPDTACPRPDPSARSNSVLGHRAAAFPR
jgi:hypothetical protein